MANIDNKFVRCEPDDPKRCQSNTKFGQCPFKSMDGHNGCPMHVASRLTNINTDNVRNYRLGQWQGRVNEFADNDRIKSLREEIGILRMMLEHIIGKCNDSTELLIHSSRISDLVTKIEKLVVSCQKLEEKTNVLIDTQQAMMIADIVIQVVSLHIEDTSIIEAISNDIIIRVTNAQDSGSNGLENLAGPPKKEHNTVFPVGGIIPEDAEEDDSDELEY